MSNVCLLFTHSLSLCLALTFADHLHSRVSRLRRYPNIACELLSADVNDIIDALTEEDCYLDQFNDFLMRKPPLNPLSASFYMRVMAMLIQKKGERVRVMILC